MKPTLPLEELMSPGHLACQGCGAGIAMRTALKALGRDTMFMMVSGKMSRPPNPAM